MINPFKLGNYIIIIITNSVTYSMTSMNLLHLLLFFEFVTFIIIFTIWSLTVTIIVSVIDS